jgi:adenosylcobinamide-phosphate synthase
MVAAAALVLAWGIDAYCGEPRNAWHPVAWFGRVMAPLGQRLVASSPAVALLGGAAAWMLAVGGVAALAWWLQQGLDRLPTWVALPLLALVLKPAFAWRMLKDEVRAVDAALAHGLDAGRARLALLCSRDVSRLPASAVRETAIETLGENFNDSLVAPLFWFVLLGLPGAWAWRAANTLDAMWGYRGRWEWAGKWAARADDLLAWLPARLAAALLWRSAAGWTAVRDEARRTPSPNGGWPMAALALRLNLRLAKPGVYVLNASGSLADTAAVARALRVVEAAARFGFVLALTALLMKEHAWR